MSRFRFRVWDGKQYHYDVELGDGDDGCFSWGYLTDNCIIEQWTGLKDTEGKCIYEVDILSRHDGESTVLVEYCEEYAKFGGLIYLRYGLDPEQDSWIWFDENLATNSIVIGNLNENRELLLQVESNEPF